MSLLQMSVQGGILVLVIAMLRLLFVHRLPKMTFLVLWLVALVRLLIPFSVPSAMSIYSLFVYNTPVQALPDGAVRTGVQQVHRVLLQMAEAPVENISAAFSVWPWIWGVGLFICALVFALGYLRCIREFRTSLPVDHSFVDTWLKSHAIRRSVSVRQSDRISAPLTYGVLRPVILLPSRTNWADETALDYVLMHEHVHIRRFDSVSKLVLIAAVCVHWFNPAAWLMLVLSNRDLELACDEAVVRYFNRTTGCGNSRAAYARTLISFEEMRSGFMPMCHHFSRNATQERIISIMKTKRTTVFSLILACILVLGTVTGFATSSSAETSPEGKDRKLNEATAIESQAVMSYTDSMDGETWYSIDGGKSFMTEDEFESLYPSSKVEWWTEEEYSAWLENEKKQLQGMIGEKGWNPTEGWYTWTQEKVDETIALYEEILKQIRQGVLYSKSVDGDDNVLLAMGTDDVAMGRENGENGSLNAFGILPDMLAEYEAFGLTWQEEEQMLYYKGKPVRYFEDSVDMGDGAIASRCNSNCPKGAIGVRTVRESMLNPDGSTNPFGPILYMEEIPPEEVEALEQAWTAVQTELMEDMERTEEILRRYEPFGLTWQWRSDNPYGSLTMAWEGRPVRSVYDFGTGVWIANSMGEGGLGPDAVDLETVYENGSLTGLKIISPARQFEQAAVAEGDGTDEGTPVPDMFQKYEEFGIEYREIQTETGMERNLYYQGELVNHFSDISPEGGVFTFASSRQSEDGLTVQVVYEDGKRTGIAVI